MDWVRGAAIGRGSSAIVYLGEHRSYPSVTFAVKSTCLSSASLLRREEAILTDLQGCPQIIGCLGHDITTGPSGDPIYNLFLEYAAGGCISDTIQHLGGVLPEPTIRRYLRSILLGIRHIHAMGYVHCDIKPQNILIADGEAKIADFGFAKRETEESRENIRGTPMYLAPESASRNEYKAAADIWALGCTVLEMISGLQPWRNAEDSNSGFWALIFRIGCSDELPEIPPEMSEEGKDFLRCCLEKEPSKRWTAEMLLSHPFVAPSSEIESVAETVACSVLYTTPRSVLGCSFDNSIIPLTPPRSSTMADSFLLEAARERVRELASDERPDWANTLVEEEEEGFLMVRKKS